MDSTQPGDSATRTLHVDRSTSTAHRLSHYDGVCGNIHGHNMEWEVDVVVDMNYAGDDNMPLDLKDVSALIDQVDHALVLNVEDQLLDLVDDEVVLDESTQLEDLRNMDQDGVYVRSGQIPTLGEVYLFWGDPTCEVMAQWMANEIRELEPVVGVRVNVKETSKYGIETTA